MFICNDIKNLGAKTSQTRYDVRTGTTYYLTPDPFTLTYSNTLFPSITYTNNKYVADTTRNPVYMYPTDAIGGFSKTYNQYSLSGTDTNKANAIAYYLTLNPEGIAVSFQLGSNTHTVVFLSTTYETPIGYQPSSVSNQYINDINLDSTVSAEDLKIWQADYDNKVTSLVSSAYDGLFTICDPLGGNQVIFANAPVSRLFGFSSAYKITVIN